MCVRSAPTNIQYCVVMASVRSFSQPLPSGKIVMTTPMTTKQCMSAGRASAATAVAHYRTDNKLSHTQRSATMRAKKAQMIDDYDQNDR